MYRKLAKVVLPLVVLAVIAVVTVAATCTIPAMEIPPICW
jgi:hypothetical protein